MEGNKLHKEIPLAGAQSRVSPAVKQQCYSPNHCVTPLCSVKKSQHNSISKMNLLRGHFAEGSSLPGVLLYSCQATTWDTAQSVVLTQMKNTMKNHTDIKHSWLYNLPCHAANHSTITAKTTPEGQLCRGTTSFNWDEQIVKLSLTLNLKCFPRQHFNSLWIIQFFRHHHIKSYLTGIFFLRLKENIHIKMVWNK